MIRRTLIGMLLFASSLANGLMQSQDNFHFPPMAEGPVLVLSEHIDGDIDLQFIEEFEGCTDTLIWPGAYSGPTIGCGIDLGNIGRRNIQRAFKDVVSEKTLEVLMKASGIRGKNARSWVARTKVRLTKEQVQSSSRRVMKILWEATSSRFPGIKKAPWQIQTAVFSCAMNRGPYNSELNALVLPIKLGDYEAVVRIIGSMQIDHELEGIQKRRLMESKLATLGVRDATYN